MAPGHNVQPGHGHRTQWATTSRRHDVTTSMFDDRGNLTWEVFIMISEDLRTSIQWMQARNAPFFGALLALIFTRFRWMTLAAFSHLDYQSGGSKTGNIGNSNWEEWMNIFLGIFGIFIDWHFHSSTDFGGDPKREIHVTHLGLHQPSAAPCGAPLFGATLSRGSRGSRGSRERSVR